MFPICIFTLGQHRDTVGHFIFRTFQAVRNAAQGYCREPSRIAGAMIKREGKAMPKTAREPNLKPAKKPPPAVPPKSTFEGVQHTFKVSEAPAPTIRRLARLVT